MAQEGNGSENEVHCISKMQSVTVHTVEKSFPQKWRWFGSHFEEIESKYQLTEVKNVSINITDISLTGATIIIKDTNIKFKVDNIFYDNQHLLLLF